MLRAELTNERGIKMKEFKQNQLKDNKNFFKVYKDLFDTELSVNAVLLLCYLIEVEPIANKWRSNYFRISNEFIKETLDWSSHIIKVTFDELLECGYILLDSTYETQAGSNRPCKARFVQITDKVNEICLDMNEDGEEEPAMEEVKPVIEEVKEEVKVQKPAKKSISNFSAIEQFINTSNYSDEIKEALITHYKSINTDSLPVAQAKLDIEEGIKTNNNDYDKFLKSIKQSTSRTWRRFFEVKEAKNSNYNKPKADDPMRRPSQKSTAADKYYVVEAYQNYNWENEEIAKLVAECKNINDLDKLHSKGLIPDALDGQTYYY